MTEHTGNPHHYPGENSVVMCSQFAIMKKKMLLFALTIAMIGGTVAISAIDRMCPLISRR